MTSTDRILNKAWALSEAWFKKWGARPTKNQAELALTVANAESSLGDAWPGWHNWGATQVRSPTAAERSKLPDPRPVHTLARTKGVLAALQKIPAWFNGSYPMQGYDTAREALYVDSADGSDAKAYWVFESAFGCDREGARYMLGLLMRGAITPEFMATADTASLAEAMKNVYHYGVSIPEYQAFLERARIVLPEGWNEDDPPHTWDDPVTPMPSNWGKALAPQGGAPVPGGSSSSSPPEGSSPGSSGGTPADPPPADPPPEDPTQAPTEPAPDPCKGVFRTAIDDTDDLYADEVDTDS